MCHISSNSYVLDVGCGVGATPCYIAHKVGCRVVGVDILEKMEYFGYGLFVGRK